MTAEDLDALLLHAHTHSEAVLYIPPDGFELVPTPPEGVQPMPHFLDDGDQLLEDMGIDPETEGAT